MNAPALVEFAVETANVVVEEPAGTTTLVGKVTPAGLTDRVTATSLAAFPDNVTRPVTAPPAAIDDGLTETAVKVGAGTGEGAGPGGGPGEGLAEFTINVAVCVAPLYVAVTVNSPELVLSVETLNVALDEPDGTVTLPGMPTPLPLTDRVTVTLLVALPDRVTVPCTDPPAAIVDGFSESADNPGVGLGPGCGFGAGAGLGSGAGLGFGAGAGLGAGALVVGLVGVLVLPPHDDTSMQTAMATAVVNADDSLIMSSLFAIGRLIRNASIRVAGSVLSRASIAGWARLIYDVL